MCVGGGGGGGGVREIGKDRCGMNCGNFGEGSGGRNFP